MGMGMAKLALYASCCVFIVALLVALLTLEFVGTKPIFYIQQLYIPAFKNSNASTSNLNLQLQQINTSIIIDLKFKRAVAYVPLRYKHINLTLYYYTITSTSTSTSNRSFSFSVLIPGFKQRWKKTVHRRAVVDARGLPWEDAFRKISNSSTMPLAVQLTTKYQLRRQCGKYCHYYGKAKPIIATADVEVDASGLLIHNNPIRLHT